MYKFIKEFILEETSDKLKQFPLSYDRGDLAPVLSKDTIDYHYGKLYKTYVDRYNAGEGDADFNEAGAYLHSIYFSQFKAPTNNNKPTDLIAEFIDKHFDSLEEFKQEVEKTAMGIQGSGWVYLARNGKIKTITNHAIKKDILLLIDWWEHAWTLDYQADKSKYLNNIWRIIDWDAVNSSLAVDLNQ